MVSGAATAAVVRAGRDIFLETKFRSASDFAKANREVIWGWKRDVGASFRAVYFSGELARLGDSMVLRKWFFFYRHRASLADIQCINRTFTESDGLRSNMTRRILRSSADRQLGDLRVELGQPSVTDKDRIWRRGSMCTNSQLRARPSTLLRSSLAICMWDQVFRMRQVFQRCAICIRSLELIRLMATSSRSARGTIFPVV